MAKKHAKSARGEAKTADVNVSEDDVARERARMLVERQAELDGLLDRHDDMVRVSVFFFASLPVRIQLFWGVDRSARPFISNSL